MNENKLKEVFDYVRLKYGGKYSISGGYLVAKFPLKEEDTLTIRVFNGKWEFDSSFYSRNVCRCAKTYKKAGTILEFASRKWNEVFGEYPNSI